MLCFASSAFLIVDSIFSGQWHVFGVRRQPPCSVEFAWLRNHPSLVNGTGAEVRLQKQGGYLVPLSTGLCSKGSSPKSIYSFRTASAALGQFVTRRHRLS